MCVQCGMEKPLDREHYGYKGNRSGYRGICLECEGPPEPVKVWHPKKLQAMCTGKRAFNTERAAQNTVIKHALKHRGQKVACYQCPACQKWHLTTHPRKGKPGR